jgi:hypothetical protein
MDPYSAAATAVAQLGSAAINAYGASKQRKLQKQAAALTQKGVGELQGGKGYNADKALEFLGLTDKSNYENMDPEARGYSMDALKNLIDRGSGTGLDVQSKQALSEATSRSGAARNAAMKAIMQDYQQRGQAGSGAELASQLSGAQGDYSSLATATGQAAAAAEQRRLEANVLASRAGQQQQQLEQQKAAAQDALQRFNVGARQNTLGLEQQYRQGAAGQYATAGGQMAGLARDAQVPYASGAKQLQSGVEAATGLAKLFGGGSDYGGPGQLSQPSMDMNQFTQPTTAENYGGFSPGSLSNPGYSTMETPQLRRNTGSAGGSAWGNY